jgi:hypothetical protein
MRTPASPFPSRVSFTRALGTTSLLLAVGACAEPVSAPAAAPVADAAHARMAPASGPSLSIVMTGLDAPRGLAFGPEGALYVVEAGDGSYDANRCVPVYRGVNCYSGTGAVSRLWMGKQERIAEGLPSIFNPVGPDLSGPQDISFLGRGNAVISIGWGGSPASRDAMAAIVPDGAAFGTLQQLRPDGSVRLVADIAAFERLNAGGGLEDSNPYGILLEAGGTFVADAGGNTIVRADANGTTSLVAAFPVTPITSLPPGLPPIPFYEAVPTEVQRGPDGALYASSLSGAPFLPGAAAIWRIVPGQAPQKVIDNLTMVTDFAIARDGTVWVTRYASFPFFGGPGALDRIAPDGTRTAFLVGQLEQPTGVTIGPDGAIYVSNRGNSGNTGEVWRFVP